MSAALCRRFAAAALVMSALVHVLVLGEHLREMPYLGVLFSVQIGAAAVLAVRLWAGHDARTWNLGAALCLSVSVSYVLSRTVGLPSLHTESWNLVGAASLTCQVAFLLLHRTSGAVFAAPRRRLAVAGPAMAICLLSATPVLAYNGYTSGGAMGPYAFGRGTLLTPAAPFQLALTIPPVLPPDSADATTDYYTVREQAGSAQLIPGFSTPVWTYNGITPGPTLVARSGRGVSLHVDNALAQNTNLHNHGAHTSPTNDGGPTDPIAPATSRDYFYPNNQTARTQWYHDHAMDQTGPNVYRGLAGMYLIKDAAEDALNLPSGDADVPLVIQDRNFNTDGTLNYAPDARRGLLGNTILVNGHQQPYYRVAQRKLRLRLLNGSNARAYELSLSNGQALMQIANEGGLLAAPVSRSSLTLESAERADVIVDFSKVAVGTSVILRNLKGSGSTADVMRFDISAPTTDPSSLPASLVSPPDRLLASASTVSRRFTIEQSNGVWTFNGKPYEPTRIDANPALNATEIWTFDNHSGITHPIHVHDINFQILDINGSPPPKQDSGWKEIVDVPPYGSARIIAKYTDFTGTYVFHCHILEHEDNRLMANFRVG